MKKKLKTPQKYEQPSKIISIHEKPCKTIKNPENPPLNCQNNDETFKKMLYFIGTNLFIYQFTLCGGHK